MFARALKALIIWPPSSPLAEVPRPRPPKERERQGERERERQKETERAREIDREGGRERERERERGSRWAMLEQESLSDDPIVLGRSEGPTVRRMSLVANEGVYSTIRHNLGGT